MIKHSMEIEGFGASLVGHAIYVCANQDEAWIPMEFVSGTSYSCKILVTGDGQGTKEGLRFLEAEHSWNAIFRPSTPKDWSALATVLRGVGPTILLVFDTYSPKIPSSFISYMDSIVTDGRTVITRIWLGEHVEMPTIPDAIFYPVLRNATHAQEVFTMIGHLPERRNHGPFTIGQSEWLAIVKATQDSNLGLLISDIGERSWSLFWHNVRDSRSENPNTLLKRGLAWLKTGAALLEKNSESG